MSSDIPSASGDVASEERESREEGTSSRGEETESRDEGTGGSAPPKKPKIRGESMVPPESKEPATEEQKTLIVPNGVE